MAKAPIWRKHYGTLDARDANERAKRLDGIPTSQEFQDAFARLNGGITEKHWKMFKAFLEAPHMLRTASQLADAAGYGSYGNANSSLGTLAHKFCDDLDYEPDCRKHGDKKPMWTTVFATAADAVKDPDDKHFRWQLRPEVAEALLPLISAKCQTRPASRRPSTK